MILDQKKVKQMSRIYVNSSSLDWIEYDNTTSILRIGFRSGGTYEYYDVPVEIYDGLLDAPSKGSYLHYNVKLAGYSYNRIG